MKLRKVVVENGSIYYVMFQDTMDDGELIVYTEDKMRKVLADHEREDTKAEGLG